MSKIKLIRITTIPLSLEVLLKNQLQFLNRFYNVIAVSSAGNGLDNVKKREGVEIRIVDMAREIDLFKDLKSLWKLILLFKREKPAIVHSNTPKSSLLSMMAGRACGVPVRIYTITGLRFETTTGIKRKVLIQMEKLTCLCATHIIAESIGVSRMVQSNGISKSKPFIIGNGNINGIDEEYWNPDILQEDLREGLRKKIGINKEDFIFIFVGRLVGDKGVNELINAFKALGNRNCKLLLVGKEESLDLLNGEVLEEINNNKNIISTGFQEDVRKFLSISHVLVLPSYREGFPNVILQAGAMKLPCIATNVNGVEDVIDGQNGIMVDKRDTLGIKEAMLTIMNNYISIDKDYCRRKVVENYSQREYFPKLLQFYKNILGSHV